MRRWVKAFLILVLLAGIFFAGRFVDTMALSYLTGQRRVAGQGFWGDDVRQDGPVPGYAFLGFSRPSEDPRGLRLRRPFESGREIGLEPGDVITSVAGKTFTDTGDLMSYLIGNHVAGERVPLVASRDGTSREFTLTLRPFVRHPGDLDLTYEEVSINSSSGYRLEGWFVPPPERSDGRVGIFVHGANSSRFQALEHGGKFWFRRGYGLLAMDLSGRGSSEGDYITYTVNEREDVRSMIRFLRDRPDVSASKIVVFGTSNGASSSIFAAAEEPDLAALALDAPYEDLWETAGQMLSSRGVPTFLRYPLSLAVWIRTGVQLGDIRPGDVITEVNASVLFVHGDADQQVPPAHSESMHQARLAAGLPSQRWLLPGGEHGFDNYPPPGIFWNRVLDFFDKSVGGAPEAWMIP